MSVVEVARGQGPVVLGLPHTGTEVPQEVRAALNDRGRALADTDWHVQRLHEGLLPGITTVRATFHRYVIDANRDPSGDSLYPGQNTTGLVPETDFDGEALWQTPPDAGEVARRVEAFHRPYHAALAEELERVRARHGVAILFDAHSIRSRIPFLFEGTLPDLNIGTDNGATCAKAVEAAAVAACEDSPFTSVLNGRFRGGWTTRHYGRPAEGLHAIQMEIAQSAYLSAETPPWIYDPDRAERLRVPLAQLLHKLARIAPNLKEAP